MPKVTFVIGSPLGAASWAGIQGELNSRGVPAPLILELKSRLPSTPRGLLLYGSWARGDAHESSDLDILVLDGQYTPTPPGSHLSVSYYSEAQLRGATQTLFGLHLRRDGVVLLEVESALSATLRDLDPPDAAALLSRIANLSMVLQVRDPDLVAHLQGLTQVARYLLRSALYAQALSMGSPCFSVAEIAVRQQEPALVGLLSSHRELQPPTTRATFEDLRTRLERVVGPPPDAAYSNLEALVVSSVLEDEDLSNLALLALRSEDDEALPYAEIPKVVL